VRRGLLGKAAREPLLHFLLLGAALFAAYVLLHRTSTVDVHEIVVSTGQLEHLAESFARINQRPPTPEELQGLIGDYVRGEVYNREALALGLDRDDPVIRNRLRQKMQFISEDVAAMAQPRDEQLQAYLQAHADAFRLEQQYTFRQVYFNPDQRHEHLAHDLQQTLEKLRANAGGNPESLGDPFLLDREFQSLPATEVSKLFGDAFAKRLVELPMGTWQGPIESGYGQHLVLLEKRTAGKMPTLEEARAAVTGAWMNEERLRGNEAFYQALLKRYKVVIQEPSSSVAAPTTSAAR
jgi:PPIC-type PPIASE domain